IHSGKPYNFSFLSSDKSGSNCPDVVFVSAGKGLLGARVHRFVQSHWRLFFFVLFFLFAKSVLYAQSVNDYRSAGSGNWSTTSTWQRWNGSAWVTPTGGQGAPNSSDGAVE